MSELSKNILATVVYYDLLDYPLTSFEIWKYLINYSQRPIGNENEEERVPLKGILESLEGEELKKNIQEYQGFYFLLGRKNLVAKRLERNKISETKYKIIKKTIFWLRFVPFIRMIAVTGRMAMKNASPLSDLDFLVVLKHGRIFVGRTALTFLVHILGKRRYGKKITDRICLNYFITDKSLGITLKDLFSSSEYAFAFAMFGAKTFRKFQKENIWIKKYRWNYQKDETLNLKIKTDSQLSIFIRRILEGALDFNFLENALGKWETDRIARDPRTQKEGSIIIADSSSLVFLPEPQGPSQNIKFQKKMTSLLTKA